MPMCEGFVTLFLVFGVAADGRECRPVVGLAVAAVVAAEQFQLGATEGFGGREMVLGAVTVEADHELFGAFRIDRPEACDNEGDARDDEGAREADRPFASVLLFDSRLA